jgi:hypothetical protein
LPKEKSLPFVHFGQILFPQFDEKKVLQLVEHTCEDTIDLDLWGSEQLNSGYAFN